MPKSKKRKPSTTRTGASRTVGTSPTAISALTLAFGSWYRLHAEGLDDHPTPDAMVASFSRVASIAAGLPGRHTLAHPVPDTLDALLDHFDDADDDPSDDELDDPVWEGASLIEVLDHLLDFLAETERWRGTAAELDESYEIVHELSGDDGAAASAFFTLLVDSLQTVADAPVGAQLAALDRWSVLGAVNTFLDWVGEGRPVSASGALRVADIPMLCDMLGLPQQKLAPGAGMWDVRALAAWWTAVTEIGLIEVEGDTARFGAAAEAWRGGDDERLALSRAFVRHYLAWYLTRELDADTELGSEVAIRIIGQLCVAISPELLPGASADALNAVFDDAYENHDDPDEEGLFGDDDEELSAEVHRLSNEYASERTTAVLGELAASGAVDETPVPAGGKRYVVEGDRRHAFASALSQVVAGFTGDDELLSAEGLLSADGA
ncbi:hypothetical protein [Agreia sp. COWG]|uniref:hypothetical protein n=1 Tax=Agreia sp. COWG TaxID=2773266 RepID=UPI001925C9BD|nr:hypothetical protein [Agreia sp. COWG]